MTVTLSVVSSAFPSVTNRIQGSVYAASDPSALISSIIDTTAGHPSRTYIFSNLVRQNYYFSLDQIDGSGNPVGNLAYMYCVPDAIGNYTFYDSVQITVDVTPGLTSGTNTFTFDGTSGKPDWRGLTFAISEIAGTNFLIDSTQFTWNSVTGVFTFTQTGNVFASGQVYEVIFNAISNPSGGALPSYIQFSSRIVTATGNIQVGDFGGTLILEPGGTNMVLTLPVIASVPFGVLLTLDASRSSTMSCTRVVQQMGETLNFLRGNIYILPSETIGIYKFVRSSGVYEWRCLNADGNFKTVGQTVSDDLVQANVFNKIIPDGSSISSLQYARLYNEVVLNLPMSQVVNYDEWSYDANIHFFSLANSANPSYVNQFHLPDRRGLYERQLYGSFIAGNYLINAMISHEHETTTSQLPTPLFGRGTIPRIGGEYASIAPSRVQDLTGLPVGTDGVILGNVDTENRPETIFKNKYILV